MNVPVIANELTAAVRTVSPAASLTAVVTADRISLSMDYHDAMRLIDFINDHQKPKVHDPRQGQLFDPTGY